jgi:hypothetical protein
MNIPEFTTKSDAQNWVFENKELLLLDKKNTIKEADGICLVAKSNQLVKSTSLKEDINKINVELVIKNGLLGVLKQIYDDITEQKKSKHNELLEVASKHGSKNVADWLIKERSANDFDMAMAMAARGGHMNIVLDMIERGASDFNRAMAHAASGGHMEIVLDMINRGANNFDEAMEEADEKEHRHFGDHRYSGCLCRALPPAKWGHLCFCGYGT